MKNINKGDNNMVSPIQEKKGSLVEIKDGARVLRFDDEHLVTDAQTKLIKEGVKQLLDGVTRDEKIVVEFPNAKLIGEDQIGHLTTLGRSIIEQGLRKPTVVIGDSQVRASFAVKGLHELFNIEIPKEVGNPIAGTQARF